MTKIQKTINFEPLVLNLSVARKSGAALSNYSITVGGKTTIFPNYYFVPIYSESKGDESIVKFTASFAGNHYRHNYPVQCQWDFEDGNKISILDRSINKKALDSMSYRPIYYKFTKQGPTVNNQVLAVSQKVTFTVIDKVGRKSVISTVVYPKPGV